MAKVGRPSTYNLKIAQRICNLVATHPEGLKRLAELYPDIPHKSTINEWRAKHAEFGVMYAEAKKKQANLLAEDILDIADDRNFEYIYAKDGSKSIDPTYLKAIRNSIDSRKWLAAKLLPRMYGDRTEQDNNQRTNTPVTIINRISRKTDKD